MNHPLRLLLLVCALSLPLRADFMGDLMRIHLEASGGKQAVDALVAFKAAGLTKNAGGELKFILWAARPNRIRTEVTSGGRTIVQGWDGEGDPWSADSQTRKITLMRGANAEDFKTDALFDNPLLAGAGTRFSFEYAGEEESGGRELIKIIALQNGSALSFVYLDPDTYLMVRRDVVRRRGDEVTVIRTDYGDYRAVSGMMLPHRLTLSIDGRTLNETVIERFEPNPEIAPEMFRLLKPGE